MNAHATTKRRIGNQHYAITATDVQDGTVYRYQVRKAVRGWEVRTGSAEQGWDECLQCRAFPTLRDCLAWCRVAW